MNSKSIKVVYHTQSRDVTAERYLNFGWCQARELKEYGSLLFEEESQVDY
jgi:hypothetical protein